MQKGIQSAKAILDKPPLQTRSRQQDIILLYLSVSIEARSLVLLREEEGS